MRVRWPDRHEDDEDRNADQRHQQNATRPFHFSLPIGNSASASAINTFMVLGSLMLTGGQDHLCSCTKPEVHALPASRG
jgi:hypothetical protein